MMDFTEYKDIWVFIETDGGKAASVGLELLNPAAQLAHKTGQQAVAVILGKDNAAAEQEAAAYGADKILSVEDPAYEHYTTDAFAYGMVKLVEQYKPSILMIGATIIGRDFGPRVSCRVRDRPDRRLHFPGHRRKWRHGLDPSRLWRQPDGHHHV